jgi:hypothetical protein
VSTTVGADSEPKRNFAGTTAGANTRGVLVHPIKGHTRMNSAFPGDLIKAPNEDMPAAIPSLIDAAVASFDADRDTSRRYLLLASALLRVKREARTDAMGARRSGPRGGLLTWQLNCVVDYIL